MYELNTNLAKEGRSEKYLVKHIGNYAYNIETHGFNDHLILVKREFRCRYE